jgi:hypothetical protein
MIEDQEYQLRSGVAAGWLDSSTFVVIHGERRLRFKVGPVAADVARQLMTEPFSRLSPKSTAQSFIAQLVEHDILVARNRPLSRHSAYLDTFDHQCAMSESAPPILFVDDDPGIDQCVTDLCYAGHRAARIPASDPGLARAVRELNASRGILVSGAGRDPADGGFTNAPSANALVTDWLCELAHSPSTSRLTKGLSIDLRKGQPASGKNRRPNSARKASAAWPEDRATRNATSPRFPLTDLSAGGSHQPLASYLSTVVPLPLPDDHELLVALFEPTGNLPAGYFRWQPDSKVLVQLRRRKPNRDLLLQEYPSEVSALLLFAGRGDQDRAEGPTDLMAELPTAYNIAVIRAKCRKEAGRHFELLQSHGERIMLAVALRPERDDSHSRVTPDVQPAPFRLTG